MKYLDYVCQGAWLHIGGTKYFIKSLLAVEIVTESPAGHVTSHNLEYTEYMVRRGYWKVTNA